MEMYHIPLRFIQFLRIIFFIHYDIFSPNIFEIQPTILTNSSPPFKPTTGTEWGTERAYLASSSSVTLCLQVIVPNYR